MRKLLLITIAFMSLAGVSQAQQWVNLGPASRFFLWESQTGLTATFPDGETPVVDPSGLKLPPVRTLCATYNPGTSGEGTKASPITKTSANLNSTLATCSTNNPNGSYVQLTCSVHPCLFAYNNGGSGSNVNIPNNVTLRGEGADKTIIACPNSGGSGGSCVNWVGPGGAQPTALVTSGGAPGSANLTLTSASSFSLNQQIVLEQCDTNFSGESNSTPNCNTLAGGQLAGTNFDTGDQPFLMCASWYICSNTSNQNNGIINFGTLQFMAQITCKGASCFTGATSNSITISPPLKYLGWQTASSAIRVVGSTGNVGGGLEDVMVDTSDSTSSRSGGTAIPININGAFDFWWKGVQVIEGGTSQAVSIVFAYRGLIMNDVVWTKLEGCGTGCTGGNENTPIPIQPGNGPGASVGGLLFINDIVSGGTFEWDGSSTGDALAYSLIRDGWSNAGNQSGMANRSYAHTGAIDYLLCEGDDSGGTCEGDSIHGSHGPITAFRNSSRGTDAPYNITTFGGFAIQNSSYNRGYNAIGNNLGTPGVTTVYEASPFGSSAVGSCGTSGQPIYDIGNGVNAVQDPFSYTTMFRWANVDVCSGAPRFNSGEVPSGLLQTSGQQISLTGSGTGPWTGTAACSSGQPCIFGSEVVLFCSASPCASGNATYTNQGQDTNLLGTAWSGANIVSATSTFNNTTGAISLNFTSTPAVVTFNVLQTLTAASAYAVPVPASHTLPLSLIMTGLAAGSSGTKLPFGKVCTNYTTAGGCGGTYYTFPEPGIGPDVTGGSTTFPVGVSGYSYDIPAFKAWFTLPVNTQFQKAYSITASCYGTTSCTGGRAGQETLTISGYPGANKGKFQISTSSTPGSGVIACPNQSITNPNNECFSTQQTSTQIQYAATSDPGSLVGDFVFTPDVPVFNEVIYQADSTSGPLTSYGPPSPCNNTTCLSFGNQTVHTSSSGQSITLTNTGGTTLTISSIAMQTGTNYSVSNTCGGSLGASSSCTITVTFTPTTTGVLTDNVVVTSNAPSSPDSLAVTGSGVAGVQQGAPTRKAIFNGRLGR